MSGLDEDDIDDIGAEDEADEGTEAAAESDTEEESEEAGFGAAIADEESDFDEIDEDLRAADEALNNRDQNARALAIRRAIEERLEAKRMSHDLDYLDLDIDD
ncbi:MAG: hypothetical protein R3E86_02935 [Pseudomonadales bacterium]